MNIVCTYMDNETLVYVWDTYHQAGKDWATVSEDMEGEHIEEVHIERLAKHGTIVNRQGTPVGHRDIYAW